MCHVINDHLISGWTPDRARLERAYSTKAVGPKCWKTDISHRSSSKRRIATKVSDTDPEEEVKE